MSDPAKQKEPATVSTAPVSKPAKPKDEVGGTEPTAKQREQFALFTSRKERLWLRLQQAFDLIPRLPDQFLMFKARVEGLTDLQTQFGEVMDNLAVVSSTHKAFAVDIKQLSARFDEMYFAILAALSQFQPQSTSSSSNIESAVRFTAQQTPKLPEIQIPKFDGSHQNFPAFRALFDSLIHNSNLNNIQKFTYLLSYLEGSALKLIETVNFAPDNYSVAYDLLVKRYTNRRLISQHHLERIFSLKPIRNDSAYALRDLADSLQTSYTCLKSLKIDDLADYLLLEFSLKLLDTKTRSSFESENLENEFPKFSDLISHIRDRCSVSELTGIHNNIARNITPTFPIKSSPKLFREAKKVSMAANTISSNREPPPINRTQDLSGKYLISCPCCTHPHKLIQCPEFLGLSPKKRHELVIKYRRCFNCLGRHIITACASKGRCQKCNSNRHHTLLHFDAPVKDKDKTINSHSLSKPVSLEVENKETGSLTVSLANTCSNPRALLGTAQAKIKSSSGEWIVCRLVLDPGSEVNFIVRSLADRLGFFFSKCPYNITGVGQTPLNKNQGMTHCTITSMKSNEPLVNFDAVVVSKITTDLPSVSLPCELVDRFKSLSLADPDFYQSSPIDILLGVQTVIDITPSTPSQIKGNPTAVLTSLGWVLMGSVNMEDDSSVIRSSLLSHVELKPSIDTLLQRFWEVEEVETKQFVSNEDEECELYFQQTTTRDSCGRYIIRLPFKTKVPPSLGSTRELALNRFLKLEKRFERDPHFRNLYFDNINDYITQGHLVPSRSIEPYVLTHHGVLKSSSDGDKVRVVFNPAEKDLNGLSLNDTLITGTKLQTDLGIIITRFRLNRVALTCDVKQMFREVSVHSADRRYLHIFWRFSNQEPVSEWEHTRLIFGASSSPFLAQRTIQQLISDEGSQFPLAAKALKWSLYVDDCLTGASSVKDAIRLREELIQLLKLGGFDLGKWATSDNSIAKLLPQSSSHIPLDSTHMSSIKVLGLLWNPGSDILHYTTETTSEQSTKRGILSRIARTYDVNGYLSPVTFKLKTLLQQLWILKTDWDSPLPEEISITWFKILSQFSLLEKVSIPRFILSDRWTSARLIGFSDASAMGMAAVVYLRVVTDTLVKTSLIVAKTRVAPLKSWTIPRLELGAACLLSRLIKAVTPAFISLSLETPICFSDSTTTLIWIRTPPYRLNTFVANRVVQIHENFPSAQWRYVRSGDNPADLASRGLMPADFLNSTLWWQGPTFLSNKKSEWPPDISLTELEVTEIKNVLLTKGKGFDRCAITSLSEAIERCSSLTKLQRAFAYLRRFALYLRHQHREKKSNEVEGISGPLSAIDYDQGLLLSIKVTQAHYLHEEFIALAKGSLCSKKYRNLSPFLSPDQGFLMVGGRLRWANVPDSSKHPYLIPHVSHLATLLCDNYHLLSGHGGPQLVQSLLHRRFWIPRARSLIRHRIFRCIRCYKFRAKPLQPPMADLPAYRLQPGRCFTHTGIDFAGPFMVKTSLVKSTRYTKCYFALFICLVTRAIHLEVVTDLTTAAFLASFDRFVSRRGLPTVIYTDQGRNFRGAEREISSLVKDLNDSNPSLTHYLASRSVKFSFNPSYAPHWGGGWERGVRSVKHHFRRIVGAQGFSLEEFSTILTRIEGILNSRPLCAISHSPDDGFDYLTPGHFLIGGPILSAPEEDLTHLTLNRLSRWQLVKQLTQSFWKRWAREYIHTQIYRPKWQNAAPTLSEGDLVYWFTSGTPPSEWPMGKIIQLLPGKDGITRVVRIKTPTGEVVRPMNKVVALPLE